MRRALLACGRKNLPERQLLPGSPDRNDGGKAWFDWVFRNGTTLANQYAGLFGRIGGVVGVLPCCLL
jgi:hypothetical protein